MDCDARAMWHNNRTSSENPQNIIDHITTFTYHMSISAASWVLSETSSLQFHSNILL